MSAFGHKSLSRLRHFLPDRLPAVSPRRAAAPIERRPTCLAEALEARFLLSVVTWKGGGDSYGYWADPLNWVGGSVPTAADDAIVGSGFPTLRVSFNDNLFAHSVSLASPLIIDGGTLDVLGSMQLSADMSIQAGTLKDAIVSGSGQLGIYSEYPSYLDGVTLNANATVWTGAVYLKNGLTLNGTLSVSSLTSVEVYGTQTIGGTGRVIGLATNSYGDIFIEGIFDSTTGTTAPATLTVGPGVTIENSLIHSYNRNSQESLINRGTILADGGRPLFTGVNLAAVTNFGTLECTNGSSLTALNLVGNLNTLQVSGAKSSMTVSGANLAGNLGFSVTAGGNLTVQNLVGNLNAIQVSGASSALSLTGDNLITNSGLTESSGANFTLNGKWTNPAGATISTNGSTVSLNGTWGNGGTIQTTGSTVNLGGNFTLAKLGTFLRTGGTVNLTGTLDDTGTALALDAVTGSWNLAGGTILHGTVSATGGAALLVTTGATLDGVTLNTDLLVNTSLTILDGLTLGGTLTVGGSALIVGSQTLGGNAQVFLINQGSLGSNVAQAILTIGPGITVHGGSTAGTSLGAATLINRGIINCDTPGTLQVGNVTNMGTLEATGGGTLNANIVGNANTVLVTGANSVLFLSGTNWVNNQPAMVPAGTSLKFYGSWTNPGGVNIMGGDFYLGGTFTLATIGSINRTGGSVNISGLLDNTGTTLALTAATGSWNLAGGTIKNGTITASGGAVLRLANTSVYSILDGVTLDTDLSTGAVQLEVFDGLTVNGTLTIDSYVIFKGTQTLGGTGQVVLDTLAAIQGPNTTTSATLTLGTGLTVRGGSQSGATFTGSNGAQKLVNQGTVDADTPGRTIVLGDSRFIGFTNTGTIEATGGGTLVVNNLTGNANTVQVTDANSTVNINGTSWINNQPVTVPAGTSLGFEGAFTNTGGINITGGTFYLGGVPSLGLPSLIVSPPAAVKTAALGPITMAGGVISVTGLIDNTGASFSTPGPWNLNGGTIRNGTIAPSSDGAPIVALGGTLDGVTVNNDISVPQFALLNVVNGLTLNATMTVTAGPTQSASVQFSGSQTFGGNGQLLLVGAKFAAVFSLNPSYAPVTLTIGPGISVHGRGTTASMFNPYGTLINQGVIASDDPGNNFICQLASVVNTGTLEATNGGTLSLQKVTNLAAGVPGGGIWEALAGSKLILPAPITTIAANFVLDGAGSTITDSGGVNSALAGVSAIIAGGSLSIQNGQTLAITPAGGTFTNHGAINLGAGTNLSVTGAFTQGADGTFITQLSGPTSASFGEVVATGAVTLGGTLQATLGTGYNPAAGQTFSVVTGSLRTGSFSGFSGGTTPAGLPLLLNYSATSAIISINPLPLSFIGTQIDDGNRQRSVVRSLTFSFSSPVTLSAGAITLARLNTAGSNSGTNDGAPPTDASAALGTPTTSDGGLTWVVPFVKSIAGITDGSGSLLDGVYTATVHASLVTDAFNQHLATGDQTSTFHRLYGDVNGDRKVSNGDFLVFSNTFGLTSGQAGYNRYFDLLGLGNKISNADFAQFSNRFGKSFIYTG
jgi:hypothetical protein